MEEFRKYLQSQKLKNSTVEEHSKNVGYFTQWLKQEDYDSGTTIQYPDLLGYIQFEKEKGITPATINLRLSSIKYYFEYLKSIGEVVKNPAKTIRVKGTINTIIENPLSTPELESLYQQYAQLAVPDHLVIIHKRSVVILGLMIWQGIHSGELQKMEISHIDLNNASVYIPSTSQSNSRQISINSKQLLSLHEYVSAIRLLLKPKGNELIAGSVRNHVQRVLQEIEGINPMIRNAQQIRGSVIINWLKKHSKRQVQYMSGHKYISSTEKYVQQDVDSLKDVLAKHHPFG
ncbi:MAG: tyrosine-type recombinase/integrase [Pseudobacter sp.]|uniref:tyrosine-type recombinase/integrase n=1 Tax=Pseudobacter sp. TaxID=2045420 RepID=UPI003F7FE30F